MENYLDSYAAFFKKYMCYVPGICRNKEIQDKKDFLKAVSGGRIIGSVRASLDSGTCLVCRLIVHPDDQGTGIGTLLMESIEAVFPHAERFELFTGTKSSDNIRFYPKFPHYCNEAGGMTPNWV